MRRIRLVILAAGLALAPLAAEGQPPPRVAVIGVLNPGNVNPGSPMLPSFRQGLRELGWVDGQNVRLEQRYAEWKMERLPSLVAELVLLQPDVIFTWTSWSSTSRLPEHWASHFRRHCCCERIRSLNSPSSISVASS